MAPKIVVVCDGGLVRKVYADGAVEVVVLDFDVEGAEEERLVNVEDLTALDGRGKQAVCSQYRAEVQLGLVRYLHLVAISRKES